ncbi:hypothetical protein AC20117_15340 [Arthrobacter crystallopoietes]|nr:hypothetical protein AC20117_15340 [Arthrobacter crystallopoietes]
MPLSRKNSQSTTAGGRLTYSAQSLAGAQAPEEQEAHHTILTVAAQALSDSTSPPDSASGDPTVADETAGRG